MLVLALVANTSMSCENAQSDIFVPAKVYFTSSGSVEIQPLYGESTLDLAVYKSGINQEGTATVSVEVDKTLATAFIEANPTYSLLPDQHYSLPSKEVSITEENERTPVKINFHSIGESFTGVNYVLPIQIKSVKGNASILESKKTTYLLIKRFRNAYEGQYKIEGVKSAAGVANVKLQSVVKTKTVGVNTVRIQGAESAMLLDLTIQNGAVTIAGAPGSEHYDIKNTPGKSSTWTGDFSTEYQRNTGSYKLYYSYILNEKEYNVETDVRFTL